jgi:hypothetical protein
MVPEHSIRRYRYWYAKLLRLYPKPYRERFTEGMEQTFNDLLRERAEEDRGLFGYALWIFAETSAGVIREGGPMIVKQNKRLIGIVIGILILLSVPLVAMLFTDEVDWGFSDVIVAGVLLFGAGLTFEFGARKSGRSAYRVALGVGVGAALLLLWANGAVGIIGSEDNDVNMMFVAVPLVGLIGAFIARFRPKGMAHALIATAIAQALVPVIALIINRPSINTTDDLTGFLAVFAANTFFVMLFVASALLFRRAGTTGSK